MKLWTLEAPLTDVATDSLLAQAGLIKRAGDAASD
jgi:hypothetical protein